MKKEVKEYILRFSIFLMLVGGLHDKLSFLIIHILQKIPEFLYGKYPIFKNDVNDELALGFLIAFVCCFIGFIGVTYFFAKICGLFKKLDNLKRGKRYLVLVLLSVFCCLFAEFLHRHKLMPVDNITSFDFTGYSLIPSYLLYEYLNLLSQKHLLFKKVGYYFSAEVFKDLYLKFKNKN